MRTFKKLTAFVLLNIILIYALNFAISQPSVVDIELKEIQGQETYDLVVLGQSHGESGISPQVIDSEMNVNSYNCARRLMPLTDVYYMLREVSYKNDVKTILLEIDPTYWTSDKSSYGTDTTMMFHCNDPMNKLDYLVNEMTAQHFLNLVADFSVTTDNIKRVPNVVKVKLSKEYRSKEPQAINLINELINIGSTYEYRGKGFRYGIARADSSIDNAYSPFTFSADEVKQKNIDAFNKIVDYCNDNNIKLVCFTTAITPTRLKSENINEAHNYYEQLTASKNVQYYDLNYCKKEYLSRTDEDYVDIDGHPMGELADKQTKLLCDILASDTPDEYFYSSYDEVSASLN